MKRTLEILLIGLLAGGLLTGCPKKDDEKAETDEPSTAKQEEPETAAQEEEEEEEEEEEAAEVDQENYLKAAYEVTCVRAKVEDTEKQKEILAEVYPRYGFTQESFDEAQAAMKDNETIKVSLESKMESCTPEVAAGFAKAGAEGAEGDEATEEEGKEEGKQETKKPARKWKSGTFKDNSVKGGAKFSKVKLMVNITDEGKVLGKVQGTREGKGFRIGLNGEISKDGTLQASGNQGKNNARIKGRYKDGKLIGSIQGSINQKGFRLNYTAQ